MNMYQHVGTWSDLCNRAHPNAVVRELTEKRLCRRRRHNRFRLQEFRTASHPRLPGAGMDVGHILE
jgi:hypothetical protein